MAISLYTEAQWLEQVQASKLVGFCLLDEEGHLLQRLDDDPELREILIEYLQQRVRELARSEHQTDNAFTNQASSES